MYSYFLLGYYLSQSLNKYFQQSSTPNYPALQTVRSDNGAYVN
ncbi:hypothetical protein M116_1504 [Bacteroides fragilis str. 3719 A10]|nr:hypothetical protein M116_1504 [Bacteroides fragilis str. 3719 A10]